MAPIQIDHARLIAANHAGCVDPRNRHGKPASPDSHSSKSSRSSGVNSDRSFGLIVWDGRSEARTQRE
jgi:hypothetical protein